MARPTTGAQLLEKYKGDPESIRRVQAVIETLGGRESVVEACQRLGICEAMFRKFRDVCLQAAVSSLDPKKPGRKPHTLTPEEERISALEARLEELRLELLAAQVREELLAAGCVTEPKGSGEKKTKKKRRPRRKA